MHDKATEWIVFNGDMDLENTGGVQNAQTVSWHNRKSPTTDPKCIGSLDLLIIKKKTLVLFFNASTARRVYTHIHM